jgi:hypothetical protein
VQYLKRRVLYRKYFSVIIGVLGIYQAGGTEIIESAVEGLADRWYCD